MVYVVHRNRGKSCKRGYLSRRPLVESRPTPGTPPPRSGQKKGFLAMGGWGQTMPMPHAAPEMACPARLISAEGDDSGPVVSGSPRGNRLGYPG